ncbi:MAG: ABC transporter permease [Acidimicrobiales bacterium]|nr:ABC transporter permease [Acidimicrobiales bacterium]
MSDATSPASGLREYSDIVHVFEPSGAAMPPVREYLRDVWARREFIREMARSQIRGTRSNTVLGELWGLIDPLFQAALYWFLISVIRGGDVPGADRRLSLMVSSIFLFQFFSCGLGPGAGSILSGKNLMLNSTFPRAILPFAAIYRSFLEFLPTIPIYMIFHAVLGTPVGLSLLMFPLYFVIGTGITVGTALLLSTLTVFIADMTKLLSYVSRLLFFATPVIYPADTLPPKLKSIAQVINPFFSLFEAFQAMISGDVPPISTLFIVSAWSTVCLVAGYRVFVSHERAFALRL